ncbi:MAG: DMT family transporter [Desulfobacula sp.]|nr:DMT family transporter [Desulfobacula sp.]
MLSILLSIAACFGWGVADFIGGLKSRYLPTLSILFISTTIGVLLLSVIIILSGNPLPRDPSLFWAIPSGFIGLISMFLLYRGLAIGTMTILAPISATGVILPVIWGMLCGDDMSGLQLLGIGSAILGSLLAAMEKEKNLNKKHLTKGIGYAFSAAIFIGFYFIFMDKAAVHHPVWASMIMRLCTLFFLLPFLILSRLPMGVGRSHLPIILIMGIIDTLAAFSFTIAVSKGMLSEVAVISCLYPAVTALLSSFIVKERIQKKQSLGIIFAIAGVVLISAF